AQTGEGYCRAPANVANDWEVEGQGDRGTRGRGDKENFLPLSPCLPVSLFCSSPRVVVTSATISNLSSRPDKCVIYSNNLRKEEVCPSFPFATSTWRGSEFSSVLISTFRSKTERSPTTRASRRPSRRFSSRLIRARA